MTGLRPTWDLWFTPSGPLQKKVAPEWFSVVERASSLLNGRPIAAKTLNWSNTVMDIKLDDGRSAFVRVIAHRHDEESATRMWKHARLFAELSILRWLGANASDLPVPRILVFDDINHLFITTRMPGLDAAHAYPRLSASPRDRSVTSWAFIAILMFRLPTPQCTPLTLVKQPIWQVVGIVDWEFYGCMPACLSATYPSWIRPPITEPGVYRNPKSTLVSFFLEPYAERKRLFDLCEKAVKELDTDYYTCLIQGTRLRDALAWIEATQDNDGSAMERWTEDHLFPSAMDDGSQSSFSMASIDELGTRLEELASLIKHHKAAIRDLEKQETEVKAKRHSIRATPPWCFSKLSQTALRSLELSLVCGEELEEITTPFVALRSLAISQGDSHAYSAYSSGGEYFYSYSAVQSVEMICAAPNLLECMFVDIGYAVDIKARNFFLIRDPTHRCLNGAEDYARGSGSGSSSGVILQYLTLLALESLLITNF
ncbi:hypothetical protein B0H19DRAFT_1380524 [Mycena capillaripes]|nr:hypothetical protein B0H19DRAFT_1380524 [Mycena capillaripes]